MNNCTKYIDWISAYVDSELSPSETEELMAHIESCPSCKKLLSLYQDIDALSGDMAKEPPEEIFSNVMGEIHRQDIPSGKKAPHTRAKAVLGLCAAMAACFAIVFFANPGLFSMGGSDSAANYAADMNSAGPYMDAEEKEQATSDSAAEDKATADTGTDTAAPSDTDTAPNNSSTPESAELRKENYKSVFTITGELPAILENYEKVDAGDGSYYIFIDEGTAQELEDMDYAVTYSGGGTSESEDSSLVIYTP